MDGVKIEIIIGLVLFIAGFYVAWNIGSNDCANCIGTAVGSGILSFRKTVFLVAVSVVIGSILQGHYVMKTVGKGIVVSDPSGYAGKSKLNKLKKINKDIEVYRNKKNAQYEILLSKRNNIEKEI